MYRKAPENVIEREIAPLTLEEATSLATKLSPDYMTVYAGRLGRHSWSALADRLQKSQYAARKLFEDAHTDLVKYRDWKRAAAA